ncbi:NAD-dependent epimerase/dehydratase family protein [Micromonospora sp. HM5-17]|jgi:UDP-2-acetamido-2,6-beta-L-arabino-hexul-4-ose reductase|uniref:polysaccharide biosynthesis C-terminal domain-containing protein n=1 Tax=Micromonospora sp. HM5-17 TaxID=2487710 RepID=UPI000F4A64DD|nr:NAD-dependent epimerase/dehydratase family protein [Micromonospora sp. HM5-17]ROT33183.1 SDR family oxidoreductase [Micromonospora sp. HM5-17]
MRLALTGAGGFLGWHVRVLVKALGWPDPVRLSRAELTDPAASAAKLDGVQRVLHLAGVNRGDPADVATGNVEAAAALARALRRCDRPPRTVAYANSVQAGNGTPYGDSKAVAAETLAAATAQLGSDFVDLRLPNLFGEHGRPHYNSVVATFCRVLAENGVPEVHDRDRELDLVHVGDAAARLLDVPAEGAWDPEMPRLRIGVGALADRLRDIAETYRSGEIPALTDRHTVRLFNTYRSHCFPTHYPMPVSRHADRRGELVEAVRTHGGGGQTFCSSSHPGVVRGEHFHLAKVERFMVLRGTAEIRLRRVGYPEVIRFAVTGDEPAVVDMPTMWAHNITNTGTGELITVFWSNELFDPARPDTYPEPVADDVRVPAVLG